MAPRGRHSAIIPPEQSDPALTPVFENVEGSLHADAQVGRRIGGNPRCGSGRRGCPGAGGFVSVQAARGYDAIAAVVDDFFARLIADPDLGTFFKAHSTDSNARIRQLVVDQLCAATGGPCIYTGRPMKQSHAGLGITEAQWDKMVVHLKGTLDKFKVGKAEQDELLAATTSLKPDIVESKRM
jgi:hemoglobin